MTSATSVLTGTQCIPHESSISCLTVVLDEIDPIVAKNAPAAMVENLALRVQEQDGGGQGGQISIGTQNEADRLHRVRIHAFATVQITLFLDGVPEDGKGFAGEFSG